MLHTLHAEMKTVVTTANNEQMKTEKLPDNKSLCLQHVCVVNHNKNNAWAQIGFLTGDQVMWVGAIKCTSQTKYYHEKFEVFFKGARGIVVKWTTCDVNDRVEAYVYGYYRD